MRTIRGASELFGQRYLVDWREMMVLRVIVDVDDICAGLLVAPLSSTRISDPYIASFGIR